MTRRALQLKVRDLFRKAGIDIRLNDMNNRSDLRFLHFLKTQNITTVLDVGANRGQFAGSLLESGFDGHVVSFEALPEIYDELKRNAARFGRQWSVSQRCALSDRNGTTHFHITHNLSSSSILAPNDALQAMGRPLEQREVIEVDCKRLDELYQPTHEVKGKIFLKIDVQGAEALVLAGAKGLMPHVKGVLLEMTLMPLYEGQPLADAVNNIVTSLGFALWDTVPVYRDAKSGRLYQYDAIYFRT